MPSSLTRRSLMTGSLGLAAAALTGCAGGPQIASRRLPVLGEAARATAAYPALPGERFPIPAIAPGRLPERFQRQLVPYDGGEKPGTVVVDTSAFYLYHVRSGGQAMRYGVGLGREGFAWSGRARIAWKRAWPTWTPPAEMIAREPELAKWSADNGGMPPGLTNPLGARALYIFQGDVDTLYRLHGTPEIESIGKAVSSGCVRLVNHDVIHLYNNVKDGSPILVI